MTDQSPAPVAEPRQINWQIAQDGMTVRISINSPTACLADIILPAKVVDAVIHGLAHLRGQMTPPVPEQYPVGQTLQAIALPDWYTEIEPSTGLTNLCLRHPGLGWLAFLLPPAHLDQMTELWAQQKHIRTAVPQGSAKH